MNMRTLFVGMGVAIMAGCATSALDDSYVGTD